MADKSDKTEAAAEPVPVDTQTGIFPEFRRLWNGGGIAGPLNWPRLLGSFPKPNGQRCSPSSPASSMWSTSRAPLAPTMFQEPNK